MSETVPRETRAESLSELELPPRLGGLNDGSADAA